MQLTGFKKRISPLPARERAYSVILDCTSLNAELLKQHHFLNGRLIRGIQPVDIQTCTNRIAKIVLTVPDDLMSTSAGKDQK